MANERKKLIVAFGLGVLAGGALLPVVPGFEVMSLSFQERQLIVTAMVSLLGGLVMSTKSRPT